MMYALIGLLVQAVAINAKNSLPGSDIQIPIGATLLKKGTFGSKLFSIDAPSSIYSEAPLILDLRGPNAYSQGYDAGALIGNEMVENYNSLLSTLLGDEKWEPVAAELIGLFLDWQWENYLGVQLPDDFVQELKGMTAGGYASGLKHDLGKLASRGITLANLPGDLLNFKYILQDEKQNPPQTLLGESMTEERAMEVINKFKNNWAGLTCSMFGVWGSRTEDGRIFTGRNLDWLKDAGISKHKLITVHHPSNGYAHATVGWAGIWGAITGMSSQGITVHEANLESNDITFRGFPWVLRLRNVMAHAQTIDEALALWSATNNTVGFNHGIGSARDNRAVVLETMKGNTAVFGANDPREQSLIVDGVDIGMAREEAVFRTNHGYDAYTLEHYLDGVGDDGISGLEDSLWRYRMFPEAFDGYQARGTAMTYIEAVNVTSIIGHKGEDAYICDGSYDGSNILSVTFDPSNLVMYAAWESGSGAGGWTPASCSTYLKVDMKQWF